MIKRYSITIQSLSDTEVIEQLPRLTQIFLDAFTTADYQAGAQRLSSSYVRDWLSGIHSRPLGSCLAAFDNGQYAHPNYACGFGLCMALSEDEFVTQTNLGQQFDLQTCLYIADLAIDLGHRGRGIGRALVQSIVDSSNGPVFVRTNQHSPHLHVFYNQCGFTKLEETAYHPDGVQKQYFYHSGQ